MPKTIRTKAVGVTKGNRQETIERLSSGDMLELEREPDNPYDENAIKVLDLDDDIGYLSRELAAEIAPIMDSYNQMVTAEVTNITGQDKDTLGVNILITIYSEEETEEISRKAKEKYSAPKPAPVIQPVISIPKEPTFETPEDPKEVISKKIINTSLNAANKFVKKKRNLKQWVLLLAALFFFCCCLSSVFNVFLESVGILPTRTPTPIPERSILTIEIPTETPTRAPTLINTPEPTVTLTPIPPTATLGIPTNTPGTPCSCTGPDLNCTDFSASAPPRNASTTAWVLVMEMCSTWIQIRIYRFARVCHRKERRNQCQLFIFEQEADGCSTTSL